MTKPHSTTNDARRRVLVLGGGAPNATLMAGAVHNFLRRKIRFDVVVGSGAGALIGLLSLVPKGMSPEEALALTPNYGIHDLLYSLFPVDYKVFQPPLPSEAPRQWLSRLLRLHPLYAKQPKDSWQRLCNDSLDLAGSMCLVPLVLASLQLTPFSKGVCANVPFIEDVIDFEALGKLRERKQTFYLNAYNINKREMETFSSDDEEITPEHFRAALALPFIYPPVRIGEDYYYEGAAHDSMNYAGFLYTERPDRSAKPGEWVTKLRPRFKEPGAWDIVALDVMGADELIHSARDLWDAYTMSIIMPLVEVARDDTRLFEDVYLPKLRDALKVLDQCDKFRLVKVDFEHSLKDNWPHALEWSYSNVKELFDIGQQVAEQVEL